MFKRNPPSGQSLRRLCSRLLPARTLPTGRFAGLLLGLLLTIVSFGVALAQNPLAVQIYYVPLAEDDALVAMQGTNTSAAAPVYTYISVAVGTNASLVYYDQWENGFDTDIANPTDLYGPANLDGTQVWGNGIAADGCPPNRDGKTPLVCSNANDVLNSGNVIVLANPVDPATLQSVIDFDGGDKIGATKQVAVTRLYWPDTPSTLLAGAIELLPTSKWGTSYISPVGEGTNTGVDPDNNEDGDFANMFEFTSLAIQASQPGTNVAVDVNGPGPAGTSLFILGPGESIVVNNILQAATVNSSLPVQVHLITADRNSSYEHSSYSLVPTDEWGATLFSPVGVVRTGVNPTRRTQITFFNPSNDFLAVECLFRNGVTKTAFMEPLGTTALETPDRSGAECRSVAPLGQPFFAISTVDAAYIQGGAGETWDWGFTLIPQSQISPQALVGLGLGRDPTSTASPNQNGSPVWVAPFCDLTRLLNYVFVDFNGDGIPDRADLNGDNDTNDVVDGISESTSNAGMNVPSLKSVRLFDPVDRDQTGALVSTRLVADYASTEFGCDIAVVWGEDPLVASQGEPGFDVGTSVPPLSSITSVKEGFLLVDNDGDGYVTRGDVLGYRIKVENTGIAPIATVLVSDSVPISTTYELSSTTRDLGAGPVPVADNGPPNSPFPLDEGGLVLGTNMAPGAEWSFEYAIKINTQDPAPAECSEFVITNTAV
ncbi:MAG: hypothetical protein ACRC1H_20850, partial [Caldilineaceae bacterium]